MASWLLWPIRYALATCRRLGKWWGDLVRGNDFSVVKYYLYARDRDDLIMNQIRLDAYFRCCCTISGGSEVIWGFPRPVPVQFYLNPHSSLQHTYLFGFGSTYYSVHLFFFYIHSLAVFLDRKKSNKKTQKMMIRNLLPFQHCSSFQESHFLNGFFWWRLPFFFFFGWIEMPT